MRRASAFMLAVLSALILLCGCGSENEKSGKLLVVTTIFPQYDFARQICGDRADVRMIVTPGQEAHSYEPSMADMALLSRADIFIYVGGGVDSWADAAVRSLGRKDLDTVVLLDVCSVLEEETVEGMEPEAEDGDGEEEEYDEHVWTSLENAKKAAAAIAAAVEKRDPANSEFYSDSCKKYLAELDGLEGEYREMRKNARRDTVVFSERFPFRYLFEDLDIKYYAAFPGCSSQSEPSLATVNFLVGTIQKNGIPCIMKTEFSDGSIAEFISGATGAEVCEMHSCHNLTEDQMKAGETYLSLMRRNLETLRKALG